MMNKFRILIILLFVLTGVVVFAQNENKLIRKGNQAYEEQKFEDAELSYLKSLEADGSNIKGRFNLGDAQYKQENYEEALKQFSSVANSTSDKGVRADAFHNLGNTLLKAKKYRESIEAYKNALRLDPDDQDTRYNMEYAKRMLKEQQKQQQQDQQNKDKDKKDQEKEDQEQDKSEEQKKQDKKEEQQDKQDKQDQQEQQQDKKEKQEGEEKKQQQQKQQQPKPQQISKEDAERMLEALKDQEKKTLQQILEKKAANQKKVKIEKDW